MPSSVALKIISLIFRFKISCGLSRHIIGHRMVISIALTRTVSQEYGIFTSIPEAGWDCRVTFPDVEVSLHLACMLELFSFGLDSSGLYNHLKNLFMIICLPLYEPIHLWVEYAKTAFFRLFKYSSISCFVS